MLPQARPRSKRYAAAGKAAFKGATAQVVAFEAIAPSKYMRNVRAAQTAQYDSFVKM